MNFAHQQWQQYIVYVMNMSLISSGIISPVYH